VISLQAVFYRASDGSEPVDAFIETLLVRHQVAVDNQIDRLNALTPVSPHLPFPHSSQVRGELRELRCHYGGRIPEVEIEIAEARWTDFHERMEAQPRRRPRAAGHGAP